MAAGVRHQGGKKLQLRMTAASEAPDLTMAAAECARPAHSTPLKLASLADSLRLDRVWSAAEPLADSPIEQLAWTQQCLRTVDADLASAALGVLDGQALRAIAPLVLDRLYGVRHRVMSGVHTLHEPMDFAYADRESLELLVRGLLRDRRPLVLERVWSNSPTVELLQRACRGRAVLVRRPRASCPYIKLDETWEEPEQRLNSGRRSDLRRAARKAEQLGPVRTEILVPKLAELEGLLDLTFAIEAKSWKGESGTALKFDSRRAAFYRGYAHAACEQGILRLCFLHIGDAPAAMQLAIECGGRFWLLKVGYDAAFAACSPGLHLMRETIRYSVQAGLTSYEFLGKAETWTQVWTKSERACEALHVYPYSLRGMSALALTAAHAFCKRNHKA